MKSIRSALYEALVAAIKASAVSPQPDGTSKQDASLHGEALTVEPEWDENPFMRMLLERER